MRRNVQIGRTVIRSNLRVLVGGLHLEPNGQDSVWQTWLGESILVKALPGLEVDRGQQVGGLPVEGSGNGKQAFYAG